MKAETGFREVQRAGNLLSWQRKRVYPVLGEFSRKVKVK